MSQLKKLLFILVLFALVFSSSGGNEATAAPQKAILGRLSVQPLEFQGDYYLETHSFTPTTLYINHSGTENYAARVPFPFPKITKKLTGYFIDQSLGGDACLTAYSYDVVTQTQTLVGGPKCTAGSSVAVQIIKIS